MKDRRLNRIDGSRLTIINQYNIQATLFANEQVAVERIALDELFALLELADTVQKVAEVAPRYFDRTPKIEQIAITPDFHKAAGIPVGTVMRTSGFIIPQAIGNDINCGMRLHTTTLSAERVQSSLDALETAFRHAYFEGGRDIPMTGVQRDAIFRRGLTGLYDTAPSKDKATGIWQAWNIRKFSSPLRRIEQNGTMPAERTFGLADFIGKPNQLTRDSQIGSIGGGNHFVEIQVIDKVIDRNQAWAWGLKQGMVTVMVHSGSVGIGHLCGTVFRDKVKEIYPKTLKHPDNGIFILPSGEEHQEVASLFWDCLGNASNFAFANRFFLALIALDRLGKVLGDFEDNLLYDAPHNLVWRDGESFLHRKGATTARADEPVLVPGSMGSSSFILVGAGNSEALESASHGAGRALSRGEAAHGYNEEFDEFLKKFRVVTPLDMRRQDLRGRMDILSKKMADLKGEAPHAYKGIGPIVETLEAAGIARPVVELRPLMTIKG